MNCNDLPGDSWRHRHDSVKTAILTECIQSGLPTDCEVYGLFADLIPSVSEAEGGALAWGRARQGLIPDYRIRLPTPEGTSDCLAELKIISAGEYIFFKCYHTLYTSHFTMKMLFSSITIKTCFTYTHYKLV